MKKKMSSLFIFILLLVVGVGCSNSGEKSPATNNNEDPSTSEESQFVEYGVDGNIVEITANKNKDEAIIGSIKVEGSKDNGATYKEGVVTITADTKIYINNLTNFDNLEVGMYVNVFFEGPVAESFPVQATAKQINIVPEDNNEDAESPIETETADDIYDK